MAFIIKRYNEEQLFSAPTEQQVKDIALQAYDLQVEEYNGVISEYNGSNHTAEWIAEQEANIAQANQDRFNAEFFNTSLGYVRRKVSMAGTGETKNFLSDILPLLEVGTPVIVYDNLAVNQSQVQATQQFINECKQQLLLDFYPQQQQQGE